MDVKIKKMVAGTYEWFRILDENNDELFEFTIRERFNSKGQEFQALELNIENTFILEKVNNNRNMVEFRRNI